MEPESQSNCISCKGCSKEFGIQNVRKHLSQRPSCKNKYSQEEENELDRLYQAYRKKKRAKNYEKTKNQKDTKPETVTTLDSAVPSTSQKRELESESSDISQSNKIKCKNCQKIFTTGGIKYHLEMTSACKIMYTNNELEKMSEETKKKTKGAFIHHVASRRERRVICTT